MKKIVLFHRDFQRFTGGHFKVWNYFNHVLASNFYEPRIAFTAESKWDATNPWNDFRDYVTEWKPEAADVLFLAGKDWASVSSTTVRNLTNPVVNLIQHPRHADPNDDLQRFLHNRAVRICVSEQVADAIKGTRQVNGPVFVIPNGINLEDIPPSAAGERRPVEVLICGLKVPDLARAIEERLRSDENIAVTSLLDWVPRSEYLRQLGQAKITVTLPRPSEGFYLPALEAMACGAILVCPDCVGNRDFCRDGDNCFRPAYNADEIVAAIYQALGMTREKAEEMRKRAEATVKAHSLAHERESFLGILGRVDEIWKGV